MRFKRTVHIEKNIAAIAIVPLMNVFFILFIFLALSSLLTAPMSIDVSLPKAMTSDLVREGSIVVAITGENVIYVDNAIVAISDLKAQMSRYKKMNVAVLLKADRRASVGRIVDVWNLCRELGIQRVNIATNQEQ